MDSGYKVMRKVKLAGVEFKTNDPLPQDVLDKIPAHNLNALKGSGYLKKVSAKGKSKKPAPAAGKRPRERLRKAAA